MKRIRTVDQLIGRIRELWGIVCWPRRAARAGRMVGYGIGCSLCLGELVLPLTNPTCQLPQSLRTQSRQATQLEILCFVDFTHSPLSNPIKDAVVEDGLPGLHEHSFHHKAPDDASGMRFQLSGPDIDRLIQRGRTETDPEIRHDIYREVEGIVARRAQLLPLFYLKAYGFARPEVESFEVSSTRPMVSYEKLWIRR